MYVTCVKIHKHVYVYTYIYLCPRCSEKDLKNISEEARKTRLAARASLLKIRQRLGLEPVGQLVVGHNILIVEAEVRLDAVGVVRDGSRPPEVLVQRTMNLDSRNDDVLAGFGGGELRGGSHLVQDAVVSSVGDSNEVGLLAIRQLAQHLLPKKRHFCIGRIEAHRHLRRVDLVVERNQRATGARYRLASCVCVCVCVRGHTGSLFVRTGEMRGRVSCGRKSITDVCGPFHSVQGSQSSSVCVVVCKYVPGRQILPTGPSVPKAM